MRYATVGVLSNLVGYLLYLAVTWAGAEPKIAMSCLYLLAAIASFLGNRRFTFDHRGNMAAGAARFAIAHMLGYLLNLALLLVFVDQLGFPHQAIQAIAIFVVAAFLFVLFRTFVFPPSRRGSP